MTTISLYDEKYLYNDDSHQDGDKNELVEVVEEGELHHGNHQDHLGDDHDMDDGNDDEDYVEMMMVMTASQQGK